jgi:hypothetical protein
MGRGRLAKDLSSFCTWKPTNLFLVCSKNNSMSFCLVKKTASKGLRMETINEMNYLTFGVQGRPLIGTGVEGRGGGGAISSSLPPISSSSFPPSVKGSSTPLCFMKSGFERVKKKGRGETARNHHQGGDKVGQDPLPNTISFGVLII